MLRKGGYIALFVLICVQILQICNNLIHPFFFQFLLCLFVVFGVTEEEFMKMQEPVTCIKYNDSYELLKDVFLYNFKNEQNLEDYNVKSTTEYFTRGTQIQISKLRLGVDHNQGKVFGKLVKLGSKNEWVPLYTVGFLDSNIQIAGKYSTVVTIYICLNAFLQILQNFLLKRKPHQNSH